MMMANVRQDIDRYATSRDVFRRLELPRSRSRSRERQPRHGYERQQGSLPRSRSRSRERQPRHGYERQQGSDVDPPSDPTSLSPGSLPSFPAPEAEAHDYDHRCCWDPQARHAIAMIGLNVLDMQNAISELSTLVAQAIEHAVLTAHSEPSGSSSSGR